MATTYHILVLGVLEWVLLGLADGCTRKAAEFVPPSSLQQTTPLPGPTLSHMLDCTQDEYQRRGCLNGGTCYVIELQGGRNAYCKCPVERTGRRCQLRYIPPGQSTEGNKVMTANIAAGVAVAVFLSVVIIIGIYVYIRYRRRRANGQNGTNTVMLESAEGDKLNGQSEVRLTIEPSQTDSNENNTAGTEDDATERTKMNPISDPTIKQSLGYSPPAYNQSPTHPDGSASNNEYNAS